MLIKSKTYFHKFYVYENNTDREKDNPTTKSRPDLNKPTDKFELQDLPFVEKITFKKK